MTAEAATAIALFALFQAKHFVCDYVLQSNWQVATKGVYGHPGGLLHAAIHAAGSAPVLLYAGASAGLAAGLLAAEYVVHYHTDWAKDQLGRRMGWTPATRPFWLAMGADQMVHHLTYVAMTWAVLAWR